jgi:hypothetical protein
MIGDGLAELGQARHRRILVGAGQRLGRLRDDVVRPAEIGKALAEIDGVMLGGERRHRVKMVVGRPA